MCIFMSLANKMQSKVVALKMTLSLNLHFFFASALVKQWYPKTDVDWCRLLHLLKAH